MAAPAARQRTASAAISAGERGTAGFRPGAGAPLIAASMLTATSFHPWRGVSRHFTPDTRRGRERPPGRTLVPPAQSLPGERDRAARSVRDRVPCARDGAADGGDPALVRRRPLSRSRELP